MKIISKQPLADEDISKIEQIFRESQCPHESLRNTFPDRYNGLLGDLIFFDGITREDILFTEVIANEYS